MRSLLGVLAELRAYPERAWREGSPMKVLPIRRPTKSSKIDHWLEFVAR